MIREPWHRRPAVAAVAFVAVCMVLILLRPLLPVDETRYLTVAWEMWTGGSRIVPHLNGEVYSHKPPLLFWLINVVWMATGPGELAARLVGPAAGAVAIVLTGRLARALWPDAPARAGRAAWMLATGGVYLAYGSATMFDTLLTVATLCAMLALWSLAKRPTWQATAALGAALAFGTLAKGPVILIHVLPVALLMPVWRPDPTGPHVGTYFRALGLAVLLALALVGLWLGPALIFGDAGYRNDILWRQTAGRMVASFAHDRPVWFFVALMPLFLWPWGWGREVAALWRRPIPPQVRFLGLWAGGALLGFSLVSGKQIHYLVPELAALALLLSGTVRAEIGRWTRFMPMIPAVLLVGAGVAVFAGLVPSRAVDGNAVGPVELGLAVVTAGLALALTGVARNRTAARLAVAPATLVIVHLLAFQTLWARLDPDRLAPRLSAHAEAGIATVDTRYAGQFSFSARLAEPVRVLRDAAALADWIAARPGGLVMSKHPLEAAGLQLVREIILSDDHWFAYRVGGGS